MSVLILDARADNYATAIRARWPDMAVFSAATPDDLPDEALSAEVLVGLAPYLKDDLLERMSGLRWIHALTTGVDNLLASKVLSRDVTLTRSRGIHGPQMAELALMLAMALMRDLPRMIDNQRCDHWERWEQPVLDGRRMCILGLGSIAEALAVRARAFGMEVTGVSDGRAEVPGFARIYKRAELHAAVDEADILTVLVPYSPATHHIVDAEVLAAMRQGSLLINIARGGCVDEAALAASLRSGHLGGAGLDVYATEPWSGPQPWKEFPNVIATPHVGGLSDAYAKNALPILLTHLEDYREGGAAALSDRVERSAS
ncbi:D-2-hydroxyacid dehydrogenase [Thioclava sp. BHET1]|nr:D-2-hydroxyacid dehydrogenase [Thioclava sp. BHET1]